MGALVVLLALVAACSTEPATRTAVAREEARRGEAAAAPAADPCRGLARVPTRVPAPARLVAIGDVHGDLEATRAALRLAGAIDHRDRWIGGDLVVVQVGDVLDRGDDERAILALLAQLGAEAAAAGGAVYPLLGNHELMNAYGDFRYVTPGGVAEFRDVPGLDTSAPELAGVPRPLRARAAAFLPGGPYARQLSRQNVILMAGDTVFVHGGVLPEHVAYGIERINREVRCWLAGKSPGASPPAIIADQDSPVWSRHYSLERPACDLLERALDELGAARMVVGHTVQRRGITSACGGRVWRIDVGLAAYYGGPLEVLEIEAESVRVLGR